MNKRLSLEQAVVLCGGLGTRLRPLTDNLPKPMVVVNGRPFLHYLLSQLAEQGITRFLLLTGYLGEKIEEYFGDGALYGWSISYSKGPSEWDTGRRIWEAKSQLDAQFLLLYSDNFVQLRLCQLQSFHRERNTPISLLLSPKKPGNIKVHENGLVEGYNKSRIGTGFDCVEIGYMIIEKEQVLKDFWSCEDFPDFNLSVLLQNYAEKKKLSGLVIRDPYHSISDPRRLALTCEYLKFKKILLIDRDGTINQKAPRGEYITNWSLFRWMPDIREALAKLAANDFKFIVITNQAGIARKMIDPRCLDEIHNNMIKELEAVGVEIVKIYVSPHHWDENSFMRKPAPGMFFQAAQDFNIRMDRVLYVGDDERDCAAAANAGCGMVYLSDEVGSAQKDLYLKTGRGPFFQGKTLSDNLGNIIDTYSAWEKIL